MLEMPPIVERMYDVNKWLLARTGRFPRDQRRLLGERLVARSLDIQDDLVAAALEPPGEEKLRLVARASQALEQLRFLLRLALDARCMSRGAWHYCSASLLEVGRMLGGWTKSLGKNDLQTPTRGQSNEN